MECSTITTESILQDWWSDKEVVEVEAADTVKVKTFLFNCANFNPRIYVQDW